MAARDVRADADKSVEIVHRDDEGRELQRERGERVSREQADDQPIDEARTE